jgi:thiamine-monophosphate kinase
VQLAGGDLAKSPRGNVAALTLIGTQPAGGRWLRRGDARPGHDLWLGGTVGESAAGRMLIDRGARLAGRRVDLPQAFESTSAVSAAISAAARRAVRRHVFPSPQLALGLWLGQQSEGAAMDVSDGVARDLRRLCRESGVGAEVDAGALPLAERFHELCAALGADPLRLALGGGEDYVLLFTVPAGCVPPERMRGRRIGRITRAKRISLLRDGARGELPDLGWDHLKEND